MGVDKEKMFVSGVGRRLWAGCLYTDRNVHKELIMWSRENDTNRIVHEWHSIYNYSIIQIFLGFHG